MKSEQCEQKSEERKQDGFERWPILCKRGREWFAGLSEQERSDLWYSFPRISREDLVDKLLELSSKIEKELSGIEGHKSHGFVNALHTMPVEYLYIAPVRIAGYLYGCHYSETLWFKSKRDPGEFKERLSLWQEKVGQTKDYVFALYELRALISHATMMHDHLATQFISSTSDMISSVRRSLAHIENYLSCPLRYKDMAGFEWACAILDVPEMHIYESDAKCPVNALCFVKCNYFPSFYGSALQNEWVAGSSPEDFAFAVERMRQSFIDGGFGMSCAFALSMRDDLHILRKEQVPCKATFKIVDDD